MVSAVILSSSGFPDFTSADEDSSVAAVVTGVSVFTVVSVSGIELSFAVACASAFTSVVLASVSCSFLSKMLSTFFMEREAGS